VRYLLDTNVISELRRSKPHGAVLAWIKMTPHESISICAVSAGELQQGIEDLRHHSREKAEELEAWLNRIVATTTTIDISSDDFRTHAKLMQGKSKDLWEDALIAAVAINHDLIVATRNTKDFRHFPVKCHNPFGS
jgi:toxin FitB